MKLLFIDHYDSFSFNLLDWIALVIPEASLLKIPFDAPTLAKLANSADGLILSPGPGDPRDARQTMEILTQYWAKLPIFGVCLGMQQIAVSRGAAIQKSINVFHGTAREITLREPCAFSFQNPHANLIAASYNSLVVNPQTLPVELSPAGFDEWGELQIIVHSDLNLPPVLAFQFHPESFLASGFEPFLREWYKSARTWLSTFPQS